jgi:hypothetical protein
VNKKKNEENRIINKKIGIAMPTSNKGMLLAGSKNTNSTEKGTRLTRKK